MYALFDWIKQIIVFIILITLFEMLVPNQSMRKYVHFVLGLLFILMFLQPLISLFQINLSTEYNQLENDFFSPPTQSVSVENQYEKQKKEIERKQVAYILNELEKEYIEQANPLLIETFNKEIVAISFPTVEETKTIDTEVATMIIQLKEADGNDHSIIEPIQIGKTSSNQSKVQAERDEQVIETLFQLWNLDSEDVHIKLQWEG